MGYEYCVPPKVHLASSLVRQLQQAYRALLAPLVPLLTICTGALPLFLWNLLRIALAVLAWAPAGLRMLWYYYVACNRQTFAYGQDSIRQQVDVFPAALQQKKQQDGSKKDKAAEELTPTVLFFCCGVWMVHHNLLGALLARVLTAAGIAVVIADYRSFPIATVGQQVQDVDTAIQWTVDNVEQHGGDPKKLVVVGESAGAHLLMNVLLRRALRAVVVSDDGASTETENKTNEWSLSDIKGFVATAAPLNFDSLQPTFEKNKWDRTVLETLFGGPMDVYDPNAMLLQRRRQHQQSNNDDCLASLSLPPTRVFHGTHDATVPLEGVQDFCHELRQQQTNSSSSGAVEFYRLPRFSHTHANLQGPFGGDYTFHKHVFDAVQQWTAVDKQPAALQFPPDDADLLQPMCPEPLVRLGTEIIPF